MFKTPEQKIEDALSLFTKVQDAIVAAVAEAEKYEATVTETIERLRAQRGAVTLAAKRGRATLQGLSRLMNGE